MRRLILTFVVIAAGVPLMAQAPAARPGTPAPSATAPVAVPGEQQEGQSAPAQSTPPVVRGGQQATAPSAPSRPPSLTGTPLSGANVRLEITITDTFGETPQTKTVALTIMSGQTGMIRTQNMVFGNRARVQLNVDAMTTAYPSGLVSTRLTVSYTPAPRVSPGYDETKPGTDNVPGSLEESITVVLTDGKSMVLSESADPATDRRVTLSAKATILK